MAGPSSPGPTPWDLFVGILLWLQVPAEIVAVLTVVNYALTWLQFAASVLRSGTRIVRGGRILAGQWSVSRLIPTVLFVPAGALLVASCYSISQLLQLVGAPDTTGRKIADGELFDASAQWRRLVLADHWPQSAQWAVWLPLAVLLAMGVARVGAFRPMLVLLRVVVVIVTIAVVLFAAVVVLAGCSALFDSAIPGSGYTTGMVWLYVAWLVLLAGTVVGLRSAYTLSGRDFAAI